MAGELGPYGLSAILGGAGGLIGGVTSYLAQRKQMQAAKQAQGAITDAYKQAQGYQQPYAQAGEMGLNRLLYGEGYDTPAPEEYQAQYAAPEFNFQADPGYQFAAKEGLEQIQNKMAGQGAGLSGSTLKAMQKYGTNLAAQTYQDSWNRYMGGRQQGFGEFQSGRDFGAGQRQQRYENLAQQAAGRYGRASGLAGIGQQAAGNLADLSTQYGGDLAGLYGQMGNAGASGWMGMGQGLRRGMQDIGQSMMLKDIVGKVK